MGVWLTTSPQKTTSYVKKLQGGSQTTEEWSPVVKEANVLTELYRQEASTEYTVYC
jgi:hypothetical protein